MLTPPKPAGDGQRETCCRTASRWSCWSWPTPRRRWTPAARENQAEFLAALFGVADARRTAFNLAVLRRRMPLGVRRSPCRPTEEHCRSRARLPGRTRLAGLDRPGQGVRRRRCRRAGRGRRSSTSATAWSPPATPIRSAFSQAAAGALQPTGDRGRPPCHAVSVGSSFESARAEGDRVAGRRIGPADLRRARRRSRSPPNCWPRSRSRRIRDLKVEFRGLRDGAGLSRAAAQPAGRQAADRAGPLPAARARTSRARSSSRARRAAGRCGSASRVSLRDAEQGNSFIPRLWARMHLDVAAGTGRRRRRSRTRSSRCPKSTTSSRRTRRCWCWRATRTASGSRSNGGS